MEDEINLDVVQACSPCKRGLNSLRCIEHVRTTVCKPGVYKKDRLVASYILFRLENCESIESFIN